MDYNKAEGYHVKESKTDVKTIVGGGGDCQVDIQLYLVHFLKARELLEIC